MTDPLRPASTVAELIAALAAYDGATPVGIAVTGQEGISVTVVPHEVVAVDCSLDGDARVRRVWVVAALGEYDEDIGVTWQCPGCGRRTYARR